MKNVNKLILIAVAAICIIASVSSAVPTFQVYSPDAEAGDYYEDQDTWFADSSPFDILVLGAFGPNTESLTEVTLLISTPHGETGTLTVEGINGASNPQLLTALPVETEIYVPGSPADTDVIGVNTGYDTKSFLPVGPVKANFNNHYPLQDDVSDFLLFNLGSFANENDPLDPTYIPDYNADEEGSITPSNQTGQIKEYRISSSGFSWVHVDAFGLETDDLGKKLKFSWDISPGSHDTTHIVPIPGAFLLGGIGVACVGWIKRRRSL